LATQMVVGPEKA